MSPELLEFFQSAGLLFFVVVPSHHMHPDDGNFEGGRLELLATRWFLISIAIEACVGNLWRSHTSKKTTGASRMYRLNDVLMSLGLGTFMLIMNSFSSVYLLQLYRFLYSWRVVTMPWDSLPCWFALVLLVDFCYYWVSECVSESEEVFMCRCMYVWVWIYEHTYPLETHTQLHRSAHTWHLFWGTHILHHSGEDYNLSTALRQSGLQSFVSIIFQLPLALLGFSPVMLQIHRSLNVLYQFWIHNSMVGWLGPVEYVLNTPSNHRMHHRPPGNCNYAGMCIHIYIYIYMCVCVSC
jgi:sterol desaturase/sphingolipid hydroxylase (fatty acid hydroxylase superfamily)